MPEGTALTGAGSQGGQESGAGQAGSDQGGGGGQTQTWRDSLPQEIRGEKSFDVFKGEKWEEVGPVMAKSYLEGQKKFGNAIWMPKEDATREEKRKFYTDIYNKLGRPEKPDGYKYDKPFFVSPDIEWDSGMEKEFLGVAHKIGLNSQQVQELVNWQGKWMENRASGARKQAEETMNALKKEWGSDYNNKMELGFRLLSNREGELDFNGEELVDFVNQTKIGNHPVFIKFISAIAPYFAEAGYIDGRIAGQMSADDYEKKIVAMMGDKTHPLNDLSHPGHNAAVEEYTRLQQAKLRAKKER